MQESWPNEFQCPDCGAVIPDGQPKGLCPRCALTGLLRADEANDPGTHTISVEAGEAARAGAGEGRAGTRFGGWRTKHTLVLVALLLCAGGWLAYRLVFFRANAVFPQAATSSNEAPSPVKARDSETAPATHFVDLSPHFNDALDDGWQHQFTPGNNLGTLPRGRQVFGGVEFDVWGIIQLTSLKLKRVATVSNFPEHVRGIHIGRKCRRLNFLHATGWNAPRGTWIGSYIIHYTDGAVDDARIIYGEGTGNWWALAGELRSPGAGVVWQGTNAANQPVQLFKQSWINPRTDVEIKSFDFESRLTRVAPFLIAATAE